MLQLVFTSSPGLNRDQLSLRGPADPLFSSSVNPDVPLVLCPSVTIAASALGASHAKAAKRFRRRGHLEMWLVSRCGSQAGLYVGVQRLLLLLRVVPVVKDRIPEKETSEVINYVATPLSGSVPNTLFCNRNHRVDPESALVGVSTTESYKSATIS